MKKLLPLGLLAAGVAPQALAQEKPNIILFLVDDMGWQETSVPFYSEKTGLNERYKTPNMERMAKLGVKFTQAYACAISSPSRASLMSGMNAARHRVTNWTLQYDTKTDAGSSVIELPSWNWNGIQPAATANAHDLKNGTPITSLPQLLHDNGYYTIHCGKAHFGSMTTSGADPLTMGFDKNIAGAANGGPGSYLAENEYGSGNFHVGGLEKYYGTGTFLTEALTLEAIDALETHIENDAEQPFYLYMAHYAIHSPYDADPRFTGNYTNKIDPQLGVQLNTSEINHAALVEGMDKSLGDIMDFLEKHPDVARNTILLFMSDNGGQAVGIRQGQANRDQNTPHRGGKGSSYMGGVHEPMMVYWPGVTDDQAGGENDNRVMIEDFFPSILEMAGVDNYETHQTVDGKSFVDLIKDPSIKRDRVTIWHFPNLWGESQSRAEGYGAYSAIMKGDYHMLYFWETQERRLYNIKEDVGETNDLAESEPELLQSLAEELTDSLKAYDAQRPSYKVTGQLIPWPSEAVEQPGAGDIVAPNDYIFKYSDADTKYYYKVEDKRPATSGGPFYWTLGEHNGYNAIQVKNSTSLGGDDLADQLFYFEPGSDDTHFRIFTVDGRQVDYVDGLTGDAWNGGNISSTETHPYMQYGTATSGEFQLVFSGELGYYGIKAGNDLLNDRGTANGSAANMAWVVNTYTNNQISDPGSCYIFRPVNATSMSGLADVAYESYTATADYVGARNADGVADAYAEAKANPSREALHAMADAYEKGEINTFETGTVYRLQNYCRKASTGNTAFAGAGGYLEAIDVQNPAYELSTASDFAAIDPDNSHANALWVGEANGQDRFRLKNLNTGLYIGPSAKAVETPSEALTFTLSEYGNLQYKIANANDPAWRLHTSGNVTNEKIAGNLMMYNAEDANTASAWYIIRARHIDVTLPVADDGYQYGTTCLPVAVKATEGTETFAGVMEEGELHLNPAEALPAGCPAVVRSTLNDTVSLALADEAAALAANDLSGTSAYTAKPDASCYVLATGDLGLGFYPTDEAMLEANKAYLPAGADAPAQGIAISHEPTVGIDGVTLGEAGKKGRIYDLSGRRVVKPAKGGVYIRDGRKVIVR